MTSSFDTAVHQVTSALEAYVAELEANINPLRESSSSSSSSASLVSATPVGPSGQFLEQSFYALSSDVVNNIDRTAIVELVMRKYLYTQLQRKETTDPQACLELLIDITIDASSRRWNPVVSSVIPTQSSSTTSHSSSSSSSSAADTSSVPFIRLIEPTIIFILLEDLFDTVPISRLERYWTIVEERRTRLVPFLDTQKVRLALLRVTSGLLRRLSRTLDTVLCGRILLFLAFILPLSERSGVNLTGQFNIDNITVYEGKEEDLQLIEQASNWKPTGSTVSTTSSSSSTTKSDTAAASSSTIDGRFHIEACARTIAEAYKAAESGKGADNTAFYRAFWRLQYMLYHPSSAVGSLESWNLFLGSMRVVLRAFEKDDEEAGIARSLFGSSASSATGTSLSSSTRTSIVPPGGPLTARSTEIEEGEEGEAPTVLVSNRAPTAPTGKSASSSSSSANPAKGSTTASTTTMPPAVPYFSAVTTSPLDRDTGNAVLSSSSALPKPSSSSATTTLTSDDNRSSLVVTSPTLMSGSMIGSTIRANHSTATLNGDFSGAKYLTSRTLLALELKDPTLRRHVILQFLIGMQYCLLPRSKDKEKPPVGSNPEKDLAPLRDLCYILLRRTPPEGPFFVRAIASILAREVYWNTWKQTGATGFERTLPTPKPVTANVSSTDDTGGMDSSSLSTDGFGGGPMKRKAGAMGGMMKGGAMGAKRLRMLGRRPLNWASAGMDKRLLDVCGQSSRAVRPQFLAYILPMKVALDYRSGIDEEYSPAKDHLYVWRGLRLFATDHLASFFEIGTGKSFADTVVQTLNIQLPVKPEPPKPTEPEVTETVADEETMNAESAPAEGTNEGGVTDGDAFMDTEENDEEGKEEHHEEGGNADGTDDLPHEDQIDEGENAQEGEDGTEQPLEGDDQGETNDNPDESFVDEGVNHENYNANENNDNAMQEGEENIPEQEIVQDELNIDEGTTIVDHDGSTNVDEAPEEGEEE